MTQDTAPATADKRSRWHALRPWLLLGGFVALWWILSTGTAQADSTPRQANLVERASGLTHAAPVRHLVDRGHQVTAKAHHATTPVRDRISRVTHSTAKVAATSIREVTDGPLPSIVKTPMTKLANTATSTVGDAVPGVVKLPESSITQGNSTHNRSAIETLQSSISSTVTQGFDDTFVVTPIDFASRTAAALGGPFQGPLDAPASAPHSASFTSVVLLLLIGLLGALMLWNRFGVQDFRMWRLARLPGGASHDPGSSPD